MPEDRIQREIEDILSKLDDLPAERKKRRGVRRKASNFGNGLQSAIEPLSRISMGQLMLGSLGLVVLAFILMSFNPLLGRWLAIAGVILFLTSFVLSALGKGSRGSAPKTTKYWRDRPMNLDDDGEPGFFDKVRGWFGGRRSPRG